jgi:DNA invertase Pin-like site-specific DNA recombinase
MSLVLVEINVSKNSRQYIMRRMKIGYARVSTDDQTLDLQLDAPAQAGCELVYQEHASGKNAGRQEPEACLKALRSGDCLSVWRLDRLGRNLGDLVRIVNELEARSVGFESVMECIETTSPSGGWCSTFLLRWPNLSGT